MHLSGHTNSIVSVAWSPDGSYVATGSFDYSAVVWHAVSGERMHVLRGYSGHIHSVAWKPDGSEVLTATEDGTMRIYSLSARLDFEIDGLRSREREPI